MPKPTTTPTLLTNDNATYEQWMQSVNQWVFHITTVLSADDLADWCSRDAYDNGMTSEEGAREALSADDFTSTYADEFDLDL
ncbi:DUF5419 family protein [Pantanalinema sp. GBBB05]|uniref:DUF5419 family protein n=1 Tax=Pantanalinema sp. GBBB05 TaxID=2604139 RepID=UPI001D1B70BB|nr:hypothetical protein [Pantanalinema sp. GBBB05]